MIEPFLLRSSSHGISHGLSGAGYDCRIAQSVTLPPGAFALASTVEHFRIPADVVAMVKDKSTWARRGLSVYNTVYEPAWEGYATLELVNHGHDTLQIPQGVGICQVMFLQLDEPTELKYSGKYQAQPARPVGAIYTEDGADAPLPEFITGKR